MLGQLPKGMFLSAVFVTLLSCYWPLRLLRYYAGFVTLILSWAILSFYSACSTQLTLNVKTRQRASRLWFALTLPVALVILSFTIRGVMRASGFTPFAVPSTSMEPTIQHGDSVIVDTRAYRLSRPQYRDVIVFYRVDGSFCAKRIIAIGGDIIAGRSDRIMVNGSLINESYIQHSAKQSALDDEPPGYDWMHSFGPVTVPANKYFVMGDNRDVSLDSRSPEFGFADGGRIVGKVLYVYRAAREGLRVR